MSNSKPSKQNVSVNKNGSEKKRKNARSEKKQPSTVRAIFAGTFDPVHYGHIDVVKAAARIFDTVVWAVVFEGTKQPKYTSFLRLDWVRQVVMEEELHNVEVVLVPAAQALVDTAREFEASFLIRSFRLTADFEYELQLALINQNLDQDIQTVYIPPRQEHLHISSTAVRELVRLNVQRRLLSYVPEYILPLPLLR
jgi:pantetheine-phosphate adenylyltransferase